MLHNKFYGQHFLRDTSVVRKIIEASELSAGDNVLEIGPGQGFLTKDLLATGANVIAVEIDKALAAKLEKDISARQNFKIITGDILEIPNAKIAGFFARQNGEKTRSISSTSPSRQERNSGREVDYKLVANLPYNITSAILEKFLANEPKPSRMVIMIQREVADRILARPGEMSLLSVVCQIYSDCKRVATVKPGAFVPPPKVTSAVISLDAIQAPKDAEKIIALAKKCFIGRRKQLQTSISSHYKADKNALARAFSSVNLSPSARPQELSVKNWITLYRTLVLFDIIK